MRRGMSTLQGASWLNWLKHGHSEHSTSSQRPEDLHLVQKEEGSKNNRTFWNIGRAQMRALESNPRSTSKMI